MPTYMYRCRKCKHRFELFHGIADEKVKRCPRCRARAERVPAGGAGILFKGSGFYITDYRSKSYRDKVRQEKPGDSKGAATSSGSPSGTSSGSPSGTSSGSSSGTSSGSSSGTSGGTSSRTAKAPSSRSSGGA